EGVRHPLIFLLEGVSVIVGVGLPVERARRRATSLAFAAHREDLPHIRADSDLLSRRESSHVEVTHVRERAYRRVESSATNHICTDGSERDLSAERRVVPIIDLSGQVSEAVIVTSLRPVQARHNTE